MSDDCQFVTQPREKSLQFVIQMPVYMPSTTQVAMACKGCIWITQKPKLEKSINVTRKAKIHRKELPSLRSERVSATSIGRWGGSLFVFGFFPPLHLEGKKAQYWEDNISIYLSLWPFITNHLYLVIIQVICCISLKMLRSIEPLAIQTQNPRWSLIKNVIWWPPGQKLKTCDLFSPE